MNFLRNLLTPRDNAVAGTVAQRTSEAAAIARIPGQELLDDPWANPEVRAHADALRTVQQRQALDASHARTSRGIRVTDRRAARAEQALEVLADARETSSAARSVLELHHGRQRFMRVAMGASLALSAGAALGVEALAAKHGAPQGTGLIAEIGLTGLSTAAILFRSHLAQHGGQKPKGWHSKVLILLMAVPLLASATANAFNTGPVGILCSIGAAAFALFSYVVAEASSVALDYQAGLVGEEDEEQLRHTAVHGDLFRSGNTSETGPAAAGPDRSEIGSGDRVRDLPALGSGTSTTDRSGTSDSDLVSDPTGPAQGLETQTQTQTGPAENAPDLAPAGPQTTDPADPAVEVSDPAPVQVPDQTGPERDRETRTGPQTADRARTKSRLNMQEKALERLEEGRAADALYLAEHGRRIPAEKLARTLKIGKPVALELVKILRGAQMDVAQ